MATIYSNPPTKLTAGDAYTWREAPADGDEVTAYVFVFRSLTDSDVDFTVTGTDEGETFLFEMDGTETSALDGADFTVSALVTRGSDGRTTEAHANLTLFDNPANDPTKTYNQRIVELLEAHLEGRIPEGIERHEIGGLPIEKMSIEQASALLDDYRSKVEREKATLRVKRDPNAASGRTVHVHF